MLTTKQHKIISCVLIVLGLLGLLGTGIHYYRSKYSPVYFNKKYLIITTVFSLVLLLSGLGVYIWYKPEGYMDEKMMATKNNPMHSPIPNLRVEQPTDTLDPRLVVANRCTSIYAGNWGMGAETNCNRVKSNPNGFGF